MRLHSFGGLLLTLVRPLGMRSTPRSARVSRGHGHNGGTPEGAEVLSCPLGVAPSSSMNTGSAATAPATTAAVVALKPLTHAKSRLRTLPTPLRRRLAWCMAVDTVRALAESVDEVCVVSRIPGLQARLAPLGPQVWVWPETTLSGINAALTSGAEAVRRRGARTVLACVADLPALRPASVAAVLAAAPAGRRSFLADASGTGTTMLIADGTDLDPAFQGRSAAAHRAQGAQPLDLLVPDARRDVDTEIQLADAVRLGVGPATASLIDPATGRLGQYSVVTTLAGEVGPPDRVVTAAGYRCDLPVSALAPPLRTLRPGQRLHAVLSTPTPAPAGGRGGRGGRTVLSAWL
jgi:2-phospho-L-lactate/phosphoenolpyruvate guanylyltransferase